MNKNLIFLSCLLLLTSCNDPLSNNFFEFLFNSKGINVTGQCYDQPSLFGEGRFYEIYSMSEVDILITKKNILNKSHFKLSNKYFKYKIPKWKKTPVLNEFDTVYLFIQNEMKEEENTCFQAETLKDVLKQEGNFYTFLYDNLGGKKLFIWDVREEKLYHLTSHEL